ncbi:tumor suppressor, Mitostatin-domain-containing protein [Dunaliella salina]|uniref:Meiosis-specific nuclear structural protein 1 n=1 Tax=Dunaliella salina TaxID=3046 RepID=A0ABQ7G0J3_DUNSA|nr:tumor suppressor, Mitostatin-domain-containing protein [Dunaliella salina]|eukprot:KAF5828122.1 tumor suppressor, Mitostatin-domain-containing protein [Dunaliella salina]
MSMCHCDIPDGRKPPKRGHLSRAVEQREMKRREQEAVRMDLDRFYAEQRAYDQSAGDPLREDIKRMGRQAKERQQEAEMLDAMYQAERNNELALLKAEEEERLATVLARRQHETERSQREVQQLREQSEELRALAEKIRTARVNKERAAQLKDNAQLKAQQQEYDTTFNLYVQRSEAAAAAQEAEALAKRKAMAIKAREVLEEQMAERQDLLKNAEEQAIRERAMVDQVVARIAEENNAEATLKAAKVQETKAFIAQFLEQQEAAKRAREARDRAEECVREREAEEAARKAERKAEADRLYEKVSVPPEQARSLPPEYTTAHGGTAPAPSGLRFLCDPVEAWNFAQDGVLPQLLRLTLLQERQHQMQQLISPRSTHMI